MKDLIGRNVYAYLMSYWEDLDDHLEQNAVMQSTRTGFKQILAFPENGGKFGNYGSNG